jgi:hypothetical protein
MSEQILSKRVTIFHGRLRKHAEREAAHERRRYPEANVRVCGGQGKWKVRRDRLPDDPPIVHPIRGNGWLW